MEDAVMLLVVCLCIAGVGYALQRKIGGKSTIRRVHGRYIFSWCVAGSVLGAAMGVLLLDNKYWRFRFTELYPGTVGFGLLAGWLIGSMHGLIALMMSRRRSGSKTGEL